MKNPLEGCMLEFKAVFTSRKQSSGQGVILHAYNPITWVGIVEGLGVQGHLQLYSSFGLYETRLKSKQASKQQNFMNIIL